MGMALVYVAIKGKSRAEILSQLGMSPKSKLQADFLEVYSNDILIGNFNGFVLILDGTWKIFDETNESMLVKLSTGASLVYGLIEEHSMYSSAGAYEDGRKLWSVTKDPRKREVELFGSAPSCCAEAIEKAKGLKTEKPPVMYDVDFEIPVDVFDDLVGFRYCTSTEPTPENEFQYLQHD